MLRNTLTILSVVIFMFILSCSDSSTEPKETEDTVTDMDGNVYQTVTIGEQVWMAENLKVTHYQNGDVIPNIVNKADWPGLTSGALCSYENDDSHISVYGLLYNWYAAADSRNIAPKGWHVPTDEEWQTLIDFFDNFAEAGGELKETGTTHWESPNTGATNESKFTALPAGYREYSTGDYYNLGKIAMFWSGSETGASTAWARYIKTEFSTINQINYPRGYALSIRCIKD